MGKQINQYTKTRTSGTVQNDDFLDFDSTEDSGTTFESAKITVLNFINYIKTQIPTIYSANSTLLTNRIITAAGLFTKWSGGDVIVEMDDLVTDHGFIVENSSSVEKARLGYDQSTSSALLDLANGSGTFLKANDNFVSVGIGPSTPSFTEKFKVNGTALVTSQLSVGNAPFVGASIQIPDNQGISIGSTFRIGSILGTTYIDSGSNNIINFRNSVNSDYARLSLSNLELFAQDASILLQTENYVISLNASYWDGSASQYKESNIIHSVTASPSGESKLDFSIDGTTIVSFKDSGVLNIANIPTSAAGLSSGDVYSDGGTLKIV